MTLIRLGAGVIAAAALSLAACSTDGVDVEHRYPEKQGASERYAPSPKPGEEPGGIFSGKGGFDLFGGDSSDDDVAAGSPRAIGVNAYLWRATLDTLAFMPLQSADPYGGVVITDWYIDPKAPEEQFKVTVYILDRNLRADGLRVSVFRQTKSAAGAWENAAVDPKTGPSIENAILTRARQLKVAAVEE